MLREGLEGGLRDHTRVIYVSPLKALSTDIHKNLCEPRAAIAAIAAGMGLGAPEITSAVRTGDTPASARAAMVKRPPHILITTPESLYLLLTSAQSRDRLRHVRTVIVDEIHAVIGTRRGAHLALSLERLAALTERPPVRIGLSATQRPLDLVARFLVGTTAATDDAVDCTVIDEGHRRDLDLAIELPRSPLDAVMAHEVWAEYYDRLADLIREHRTTLVFVNTRKMAERLARQLADRLGDDAVAAHHGSLSKERRLEAEQRLKSGGLRVVVATASLELGIDIGHVDLVCQIGSPRRIATFLQRIGRAGHTIYGTPKGRVFPETRDDLVECVALFAAAYMAEVIRGGLQAIPKGQYEGAMSLGLGYWQMMRLIILPQALRIVIPGIVNTFIGLFKDTTLLLIVGIFDFLRTVETTLVDPTWSTPTTRATGYAFAGIFYFLCCWGMSRYSIAVEKRLAAGQKR